ncbi:hypothetical protein [Oscillatoria sp. FACHB-1406]|uniref:hypothetical protein n=1 Tax=Oscillatoria sp. FACHB-1406 TaxID=2692846 RepID=UPI0016855116|nr:hypothetical protein [Oscillatoria sp. FACHB-1406]MBD2578609.1 hypothetical protein [Oscillatoria sp. FACHB-1406]
MKRRTSVETSQTPSPHSRLAAALSCMDVQLEAELARYRRQRHESEDSTAPKRPTPSAYVGSRRTTSLGTTEAPGSIAPLVPMNEPTEAPSPEPLLPPAQGETLPPPSEPPTGTAPYFATASESASAPNDYLESSEQLLRGLDPEPIVPPAPPRSVRGPNLADRLLTPLGVVSMLLLLISGTLLAAALIDPALVSKITGSRAQKSKTTVAENPSPAAVPAAPTNSQSPKLETDEFVQLNLDNLSTVEGSPKPAIPPTPASSPVAVPPLPPAAVAPADNSSNLTRALIPPVNPSPVASPSPATSPSSNVETAPAPKQGDRFYYVISNYAGEASLQQAKGTVPDAYLRQFGGSTQIQMGAFLRQSEAEGLAKQLQAQGYSASVYHR